MGQQNLRLYERVGLLEPGRTDGGTRRNNDNKIVILRRIAELLGLGLNISGIRLALTLEAENTTMRPELSRHSDAPDDTAPADQLYVPMMLSNHFENGSVDMQVPVLIIRGIRDPVVSAASPSALAHLAPKGRHPSIGIGAAAGTRMRVAMCVRSSEQGFHQRRPMMRQHKLLGRLDVMENSDEVTTQGSTVEDWTRALAQSTGSPGGGAGAGLMLSLAAALTSMVAGYTEAEGHERGALDRLRERARSLRNDALELADQDASASRAFGAAFHLEPGPEREAAISRASLNAAKASAVLGKRAMDAIEDLAWLAANGNPALVADVVVAFGALRATVGGARTNVSFDLASLTSGGNTMEQIREEHPALWAMVGDLNTAIERIDALTAEIDRRAAPTDAV
jgi:formiminotetrahydrofolate cyclodeaminase